MNKLQIKFIEDEASETYVYFADKVYWLPEKTANHFINTGKAKLVKAEEIKPQPKAEPKTKEG